jgi:UDP-glucuronate decarboxylase
MHPSDGRVVSNFIVQALREEPITLYGEGGQTRSFCYVDDLVDGLVRLMESGPAIQGPINIGNPNEFTIRQLAELVLELTGSRVELIEGPLPTDDPKQRQPDIDLAQSKLGWEPRVQLRDGLAITVAYFENLLGRGEAVAWQPSCKAEGSQPATFR